MYDNKGMDFWNSVRELIKAQNTTQEWIAGKSNISFATLRGWMTKDILPRADEAVAIAKALGTTVEFLVTGEESKTLVPPFLQTGKRGDILKDLASIDDEILDTIMIMIRSIAENCRKKKASRERTAG